MEPVKKFDGKFGMKMAANEDAWKYWYPRKEEIVDKDVIELEKIFREHGVSIVLDLGCGTGRHTVYLAEKGFDVYGFDFSRYAVARSKEKLKQKNLSAQLIVCDMRKELPFKEKHFHAIIAIRVIHHATVAVIKHVISEISRMMNNEGYFYSQLPTLERTLKYESVGAKMEWIEPGTEVPLEGAEKGIPHHGFTEQEIMDLLANFDFELQEIREIDEHYNVLAVKKL